jgi:hypothetical protein
MEESVRHLEIGLDRPSDSAMDLVLSSEVGEGSGLRDVGGLRAKIEISDGPDRRMKCVSSSVTNGCLKPYNPQSPTSEYGNK